MILFLLCVSDEWEQKKPLKIKFYKGKKNSSWTKLLAKAKMLEWKMANKTSELKLIKLKE